MAHIVAALSDFRVDSGLGLLPSICGFHLVVESGSFGFYHLPEERSGGTHALILRGRPGNSTFFCPIDQNLVIWLHLPAKEAERYL